MAILSTYKSLIIFMSPYCLVETPPPKSFTKLYELKEMMDKDEKLVVEPAIFRIVLSAYLAEKADVMSNKLIFVDKYL